MRKLPSQHRLGLALALWIGLSALPVVLGSQLREPADLAGVAVYTAMSMVIIACALAVHELAHAGVAAALRVEVAVISVGVGPRLAQWRLGETALRLHAIPIAGHAILATPHRAWLRLRLWFAIAAGPAGNLAVAAVAGALRSGVPDETIGAAALELVGWFNTAIGLGNLVPFGRLDGAWLVRLLLGAPVDPVRAVWHALAAERALEQNDIVGAEREAAEAARLAPKEPWLWEGIPGMIALERGDCDGAIAAWQALLVPEAPPVIVALRRNNLAWALLQRGGPGDLERADELSAQALASVPREPWAAGTRGAVLIARGQLAEGVALVTRAASDNDRPRMRGHNHTWLAIGHAALGDRATAAAHLARARQLYPTGAFVPRAEAAVAAA